MRDVQVVLSASNAPCPAYINHHSKNFTSVPSTCQRSGALTVRSPKGVEIVLGGAFRYLQSHFPEVIGVVGGFSDCAGGANIHPNTIATLRGLRSIVALNP